MRPRGVWKTYFISLLYVWTVSLSSFPITSHLLQDSTPPGILYVVLMVGGDEGHPSELVLGTQQSAVLLRGKAGQPASPPGAPGRGRRHPGVLLGDWWLDPAAQGWSQQGPFPGNLQASYPSQEGTGQTLWAQLWWVSWWELCFAAGALLPWWGLQVSGLQQRFHL